MERERAHNEIMTNHTAPSTFTNNDHVTAALVSALADRIFSATEAEFDTMAKIAGYLENAQLAMEDGYQDRAADFVESAASRVFGQGSKEYAEIAGFFAADYFRVARNGPGGAVGFF